LAQRGIMEPFMRMPLHPVSDDLAARIQKETKRILK